MPVIQVVLPVFFIVTVSMNDVLTGSDVPGGTVSEMYWALGSTGVGTTICTVTLSPIGWLPSGTDEFIRQVLGVRARRRLGLHRDRERPVAAGGHRALVQLRVDRAAGLRRTGPW